MKITPSRITLIASFTFLLGVGGGYVLGSGGQEPTATAGDQGLFGPFALPVTYGDLGPRLLAVGAISYERLAGALSRSSTPLTYAQTKVLREASSEPIVIGRANGRFLLDFFWALGLANRNAILTEGPMVRRSGGQIERFASTGGWRLGAKPVTELYAATPLVTLTPGQQARLERVASGVYRPCCDNPALFPDCNHGMAMLGMLTLLASQDAGEDEMFAAAKYANTVWFPEEYQNLAVFLSSTEGVEFRDVDAETLVGAKTSSRAAYEPVRAYLAAQGPLDLPPDGGVSAC
ncbi:MAG: hypothetical protein BMS9Abin29_2432 [Gemmatimonadota bacterium]|nr:MAG: hypothetical protein BMS9Abin29_2432 [Gemmatimonadota bacterium]